MTSVRGRFLVGVLLAASAASVRTFAQQSANPTKPIAAESPACQAGLSPADQKSIRGLIDQYRLSWLKGDQAGVLATFTKDAVLLPAHGAAWIAGTQAIANYWWPKDAPPTTITKLDITIDSIQGGCGSAWAHGRDDVGWTSLEGGVNKTYEHPGTYLNVFSKQPDGAWKIVRHMWDDGSR